jgi:hypothetical protein
MGRGDGVEDRASATSRIQQVEKENEGKNGIKTKVRRS